MPRENVCPFCGTVNPGVSLCRNCGAPLPTLCREAQLGEVLRPLCRECEAVGACFTLETVPEDKLRNAREACEVPEDEQVLLVCDCTVFGSARVGFVVGTRGLYWNNDWSVPTKRRRLNWADFAERQIERGTFAIDLGCGDTLDVAALGGAESVDRVLRFLGDMQQAVRAWLAETKEEGRGTA